MDPKERTRLVQRYRDGAAEVERALKEIGRASLDTRPEDGSWTPREIVHHLADSEMTSAIRLRTLLAEDEPLIRGYDEEGYARRFAYAERPVGPALEALRAARATTLQILERLADADWARAGRHSESGDYGVETWLRIYSEHAHEHADQIRRAAGR